MNRKRVKTILSQNNMDDRDIERIDFHMNILNSSAEEVLNKLISKGFISDVKDLSEQEIAQLLARLIKKCDIVSDKYDRKLDTEMTKIGLKLEDEPKPKTK